MKGARGPTSIVQAIEARDYLRRSSPTAEGQPHHKEWHHFVISGPTVDVLVNFSLMDDANPSAPRGAELAYVTFVVRDDAWEGDVELFSTHNVQLHPGSIDLELGPNALTFCDGAYRVRLSSQRRRVTIDLVLEPVVLPLEANNIHLDDGAQLNWVVVPRLRASGEVRTANKTHRMVNAPAYHDHNWGHFTWGRNFAWEWGYAVPSDPTVPYSLAFVRLSDRGRRCTSMQAIFLWHNERHARVFRDAQVSVRSEGLLRASAFKLPRVSNLVNPGSASDVPRRICVSGAEGRDWLRLEFTCKHVAQLALPNDADPGVSVINEVVGDAQVRGMIADTAIEFSGRSISEFLGD